MQFIVPQFIDIRPKVFGPLRVREFLIMLGTALLIFIEWNTTDFSLFIVAAVLTVGAAILIAFVKINGRPFHRFVLDMVGSLQKPAIRVWGKAAVMPPKEVKVEEKVTTPPPKRLPTRGLSDLTLIVDTGGAYREE